MGPKHITVLGGGVTGLVAAYRLSEHLPSTQIVLVEACHRLGGWVHSERRAVEFVRDGRQASGEVILEGGPRSIRPRGGPGAARMLKLLRDLGLEESIIPISKSHPSAKNRFLLSPSQSLIALPTSPLSFLSRQPPMLRGLLRGALLEPFHPRAIQTDESIDAFFRRRLGASVADNLASAMVHGIYAADSREVSMRSAFGVLWEAERKWGSVLLGVILGTKSRAERAAEKIEWDALGELGERRKGWSLYGLRGGLGTLTRTLTEGIRKRGVDVRLGQPVTSLDVGPGGIEVSTPIHTFSTSRIISALPPSRLAPLLTLPHLTTNPSTSVGVINLVFPLSPTQIHPPGFGYLVPRSPPSFNPHCILGVIFDSTALPGPKEPEGVCKLTVMMGGPYWSSYLREDGAPTSRPESAEELVASALSHLHTVFPVLGGVEPLIVRPALHIDCIPTYLPGHGGRMRQLHEAIIGGPWVGKLSLAGNGYGGVGVNDCVFSAEEVVRGIASDQKPTGLERWANWS